MDQVERRVLERKALAVGGMEREPGRVPPLGRRLDIDCYYLVNPLAEQLRNAPVSAADVEERLLAAKVVAELVDAAAHETRLSDVHAATAVSGRRKTALSCNAPYGRRAARRSRRSRFHQIRSRLRHRDGSRRSSTS